MAMHHLSYHSITSTNHPKMHLKKYQGAGWCRGRKKKHVVQLQRSDFPKTHGPMFEWIFTMILSKIPKKSHEHHGKSIWKNHHWRVHFLNKKWLVVSPVRNKQITQQLTASLASEESNSGRMKCNTPEGHNEADQIIPTMSKTDEKRKLYL